MKLSEIRALCEAATPGPWTYSRESYATRDKDGLIAAISSLPRNGELIAASRTLMPLLLKIAEVAQDMVRQCPNANPNPCGRCDLCDLEKALAALEQE